MLVRVLLFNINRKAYVGRPIRAITFDLSDFHRSESRPLDFEALYLVKKQS